MKSLKLQSRLLVACIALASVAALLKASYYQSDFFPIGLNGVNPTDEASNCPYGALGESPWSWDQEPRSERNLIYALGINCVGSQDAKPSYLIDLTNIFA